MVIDILTLRSLTDPYVEKVADTLLNENPVLTEEQVARPTCEMLAAYFYMRVSETIEELNANAKLKAAAVELRELEGKKWGAAPSRRTCRYYPTFYMKKRIRILIAPHEYQKPHRSGVMSNLPAR